MTHWLFDIVIDWIKRDVSLTVSSCPSGCGEDVVHIE